MIPLIMTNAFMLWKEARRDPSIEGRALSAVLSHPAIGDTVMEITRAIRTFDPAGLGKLVNIRREPISPWAGSGPAPEVIKYDIDTVVGEKVCWHDCVLIRVLEGVIDPIEEAKIRGFLI